MNIIINTNKFKTNSILVLFKMPLKRQTATLNALLPIILEMGCGKYDTKRKLNIKIEELDGSIFYIDTIKKGDNQILQFLIEFPKTKKILPEIMSFLQDVILNPLVKKEQFLEQNFVRAKSMLIDNINAQINNKRQFAKNRCVEEMCKGEDFGVYAGGYIEDFENNTITSKTLYKHYNEVIQKADISLCAIGELNENDIKFNVKNNVNNEQKPVLSNISLAKRDTKYIKEKLGVLQGKLCLGFKTGIYPNTNEFVHLILANEILGGFAGSNLFKQIREKQNLCYYISSFVYMFKGIVFVECGIDFENYEKTVEEINNEVNKIKNGKICDEIIDKAKKSLNTNYKSIPDYNIAIINYYYTNYLANIDITIDEIIERIQKISKDEIVKTFNNIYLDTCYFIDG